MILRGDYMPGDVIHIDAKDNELTFVPVERVELAG